MRKKKELPAELALEMEFFFPKEILQNKAKLERLMRRVGELAIYEYGKDDGLLHRFAQFDFENETYTVICKFSEGMAILLYGASGERLLVTSPYN